MSKKSKNTTLKSPKSDLTIDDDLNIDKASFKEMKKKFGLDKLKQETTIRVSSNNNERPDYNMKQITMPQVELQPSNKIGQTIVDEYNIFNAAYKNMCTIQSLEKNDPMAAILYALVIYQKTQPDTYLFNYVASYLQEHTKDIFERFNNAFHYLHASLYVSTVNKTISLCILDKYLYCHFWSDVDPLVQKSIDNNASLDKQVKLLNLSIPRTELKSYIGFKSPVLLSEKKAKAEASIRTAKEKQQEIYQELYDELFNHRVKFLGASINVSKFKHTFMHKKFERELHKLMQESQRYQKVLAEYTKAEDEIQQLNKYVLQYQQELENVKNDAHILDNMLDIFLASDEIAEHFEK